MSSKLIKKKQKKKTGYIFRVCWKDKKRLIKFRIILILFLIFHSLFVNGKAQLKQHSSMTILIQKTKKDNFSSINLVWVYHMGKWKQRNDIHFGKCLRNNLVIHEHSFVCIKIATTPARLSFLKDTLLMILN